MKKITTYIYALIAAVASCALASCADNDDYSKSTEGEEITVSFGIEIPGLSEMAATRTFGETTDFKPADASIKILAFDENNLLTNVYEGQYISYDSETCKVTYQVTLKTTDQHRNLHIIVNHNGLNIEDIPFGTESDIFNSDLMTVDEGTDVYWQRVEMPYGISKATVQESLGNIKLVRNYCKITLNANEKAFGLKNIEWGLMVIPTKGTVAPYLKDQEFANYLKGDGTQANYEDLTKQCYTGHTARKASNAKTFYRLTLSEECGSVKWESGSEPLYLFENEGASESSTWQNTAILLRGNYVDANGNVDKKDTTYYLVSLVDPSNEYKHLNLLRNISYQINIEKFYDSGYGTALEAFTRASGNNISGSTVTSSFTSIMSGESSLRVEYVKKYILSANDFTLNYRYIPNVNSTDNDGQYISSNDLVTLKYVDENYDVKSLLGPMDDFAIKSYSTATSDNSSGYRQITFTPGTIQKGEQSVKSTIRVAVTDEGHTNLYRNIDLILRERYKMKDIALTKDTDDTDGDKNCYTLTVAVPAGMPKELFPLDFTLEASPMCIYPNVDKDKGTMEVNTEEASLFNSTDYSSFNYHRKLTWSEFEGLDNDNGYKNVPFYFKVNTVVYNSGVNVRFGVYCESLSPDPDGDINEKKPQSITKTYTFKENEFSEVTTKGTSSI